MREMLIYLREGEQVSRSVKWSAPKHSNLVGRQQEMAEAIVHLEESLKGFGRTVLVVGETGAGKSRLLSELGTNAETKGVLFFRGRCLYQENAKPYLPFLEAFGGRISIDADVPEMDMRIGMGGATDKPSSVGLLPLTSENTTNIPNRPHHNIREERDRLFESLYATVIEISNVRPLLLVIDDLQWADDGSLRLLHYLARNIKSSRVMICGAYSPEELNRNDTFAHSLPETLRRMRIEKLFHEIKLNRLNQMQTTEMIESLVGRKGLPAEFTKQLYDESEGNPFFVEEVLKSLVNEGLIDVDSYEWVPTIETTKMRLPGTVKDVIARRIDRLDEKTKNVLKYVSVIGNSFTFKLLRQISNLTEEELIDAIDSAIGADIIQEDSTTSSERYKFDHALIRGVIYDSMSRSRRRLLHRRVGEVIEEIYKHNIDEVVFRLAHHFYEARDLEKTLLYTIKAGTRAADTFSPEDAIRYFSSAMETLEDMEASDRRDVMKLAVAAKLGDIYNTIGEWENAHRHHRFALELSKALKDEIAIARAHRALGHIKQNTGEYDSALKHFQSALKIAQKESDFQAMADIYRGAGRVCWRKGEFDAAIEYFEKSLEITKSIRDEKVMATTCIELGNVYSELSDWQKAIDYQTKSLKLLEKHGDFYEMGRNLNNIGVTYARKGDMERAVAHYERSIELSNRTGNVRMAAWALFNAGEAYARIGRFDRALECCEKSLSIFERLDEKLGISGAYMSYGIVYKLTEKWDLAIQYFERSVRIREELDMPYRLADGYYEFGLLYMEKGDFEQASEYLEQAKVIFIELGAQELTKKVETQLKNIYGMRYVKDH
jgi:tetratricopeptide (TPR) repeat protein